MPRICHLGGWSIWLIHVAEGWRFLLFARGDIAQDEAGKDLHFRGEGEARQWAEAHPLDAEALR